MRQRPIAKLRPSVERFEEKLLLSAGRPAAHVGEGSGIAERRSADVASAQQSAAIKQFTLFRITNPTPFNTNLTPPFHQVLVQDRPPIPGQVYNVLSVSVRNGTSKTFGASDGLTVRISNQTPRHAYPILTGSEQWKPGEFFVFYILTKKYYPLSPVTSGGFQFNFTNGGIAIPGPSGIFLRVKYNPARFSKVLDAIVAFGPGAKGHELGLPDTAIWEFVSPRTYVIPL